MHHARGCGLLRCGRPEIAVGRRRPRRSAGQGMVKSTRLRSCRSGADEHLLSPIGQAALGVYYPPRRVGSKPSLGPHLRRSLGRCAGRLPMRESGGWLNSSACCPNPRPRLAAALGVRRAPLADPLSVLELVDACPRDRHVAGIERSTCFITARMSSGGLKRIFTSHP